MNTIYALLCGIISLFSLLTLFFYNEEEYLFTIVSAIVAMIHIYILIKFINNNNHGLN